MSKRCDDEKKKVLSYVGVRLFFMVRSLLFFFDSEKIALTKSKINGSRTSGRSR